MPPPGMHPHQLLLPLVSYVLQVAVFWALRGMNMVADLVKEDPPEKAGPNQLESERPSGDALEGLIDEYLDPGGLRTGRMMVESGRSTRVPELLATVPAPLPFARSGQGDRVRQDDSSKSRQSSWGHRVEELLHRWPDAAARPVLSVCFDNLNHGHGAYRQRHERASATSNKRLKLTKPGSHGASQLNLVLDRH